MDGLLYAVGGQDGVSCLNVVERYDPKENKWSKVACMNTRRLGVAVAVLGNYLYAIGGSDGQAPLSTGKCWLCFALVLNSKLVPNIRFTSEKVAITAHIGVISTSISINTAKKQIR
ncbi:hypothetical protein QYM36_005253 [Artemia franciscana]|uniref:Uncharacterized protein n=2 Tax=Artemia franciscana TaxID=6661 RepID=A0AA88IDA7_ARTSF|nr:hypothetical protein QYM36_005253 [Artemia franciscana]